jgi:SAM-dependent methyltransferase
LSDDELLKPFEGVRYERVGLYESPDHYLLDYAGYRAEIPFYRLVMSVHGDGGAYAELGAGTGRIALQLAEDGYRVHAVEPAEPMLAALVENLAGLPAGSGEVSVEAADAASFVGFEEGRADVISFPFNGIMHLYTRDALQEAFAHVAERLAPGGCFALDVTAPSWEEMSLGGLPWGRVDERTHPKTGERVLTCDHTVYDQETRILASTYRFVEEGADRGFEVALRQRMWTWQEVLGSLEDCGFEVDLIFGDVNLAPFKESSPRLMVSAKRR